MTSHAHRGSPAHGQLRGVPVQGPVTSCAPKKEQLVDGPHTGQRHGRTKPAIRAPWREAWGQLLPQSPQMGP